MSEVKIPEGYKQTEVGVIPEDWEVLSLSDVATFGGGTTPPRKFYKRYYVGGCHAWVKTLDLNNSFIWNTEEQVTEYAFIETSLKKHPAGTVLVAMYGGFNQIGRTGLLKVNAAMNQALVAIIPKREKLAAEYLLYNLNYNVEYWKDVASSSRKDPNITSNDVKKYLLPIPPKQEQTTIATALSDIDDLIGSLEKLITKKEAIKTATMQQLLTGQTRLPEFATHDDGNAKGFKQTELGLIPEDWKLLFVREVCDLLTGFPFPSSKYQESGIRLLRGSNVKRGNTDWSDNITKFWAEPTNGIEQYFLQEADIVISMDGSLVGRSFAQLSSSDLPALLLQRVARLRTSVVSQNYLKEWVCSSIFSDYCDSVKTVTAIPHISPADILNFRLFIPNSKAEQTAIATILSDMDSEIHALQKRLDKTQDIKQGMMQQLLTGKVRLMSFDSLSTHSSADNGDCLA